MRIQLAFVRTIIPEIAGGWDVVVTIDDARQSMTFIGKTAHALKLEMRMSQLLGTPFANKESGNRSLFRAFIWHLRIRTGRETMKSIGCAAILAVLVTTGCVSDPKSGKGFTLPDGDAEAGKATYVALQCNACHKIAGVEQLAGGDQSELSIALGGEVTRIKTYGELVTSIINPSHRLANGYATENVSVDGESKMTNYNDAMTVTQLTDVVAFLQSKYKLREYDPTDYPMYGP